MTFELLLAGDRVKPHQVIALHLMSGSVFTATGALLYQKYPPLALLGLGLLIVGAVLVLLSIFRTKWMGKDHINLYLRIAELVVSGSLAVMAIANQWLPAIIMFSVLSLALLFALFSEKKKDNKLTVKVSEEGILLPPVARRKALNWHEVQQVLLRHGTITIDSTDNKLYQWAVATINFDPATFEAFCRSQIDAGKSKRKNDW